MTNEANTYAGGGGLDTAAPVVVGLFQNASDAHQALAELRAQGFHSNQIGAAFRGYGIGSNRTGATVQEHESWWDRIKEAFRGETASEHTSDRAGGSDRERYERGEHEYDYEGEDFEGSLASTGIPTSRASYLVRNLESGGAIVTVRDPARAEEAERILSNNNGNIRHEEAAGDSTQNRASGASGTVEVAPSTSASDSRADASDVGIASSQSGLSDRRLGDPANVEPASDANYSEQGVSGASEEARNLDRVQLFGEVLRVHKDRIQRGEVRVRKDVVSEHQTIEVPVVREELVLERVPVTGVTEASSSAIGGSDEIRIPLSEEKVRLEKQAVVREEVRIGKREVSNVASLDSEVQHEELRVDSGVGSPEGSASGENTADDFRRRG